MDPPDWVLRQCKEKQGDVSPPQNPASGNSPFLTLPHRAIRIAMVFSFKTWLYCSVITHKTIEGTPWSYSNNNLILKKCIIFNYVYVSVWRNVQVGMVPGEGKRGCRTLELDAFLRRRSQVFGRSSHALHTRAATLALLSPSQLV